MRGTPRAPTSALAPLLSIVFIGTMGFSLVLPFLVFLVVRLGGNAFVYGLLGATYSAFQLVGAPVLGRWSDTAGRRKVLLLSQLGTLAAWILFLVALLIPVTELTAIDSGVLGAFTLTVPLLIIFGARALDGLTGGNVSVANAYLADVTPDEQRSAGFGKMAVAQNLGFVAGPAIAGLLGATGSEEIAPVLAAIAISLVASLLIAFRLPESRPTELTSSPESPSVRKVFGQEQRDCYRTQEQKAVRPRRFLSSTLIISLLAVHFLVYLGFNFFYVSFPVHAATALQWELPRVGIYFSVLGGAMALVQGPVLSRVSRRTSDRGLLLLGGLILALSFLTYTRTGDLVVFAAAGLLALGNGLMWPSILALLSRAAGEEVQGAVQGFAGSSAAVASIIGLIAGGMLYASLGGEIFNISAAIILGATITGWVAGGRCGDEPGSPAPVPGGTDA